MGLTTAMIGMSVVSAGLKIAGSFAGSSAAGAAGARQMAIIRRNFEDAQRESTRQQNRVNDISDDLKQDRSRLSDKEAATIQVIASERGVSDASLARLTAAEAYAEGLDLSRIEDNRVNDIEGLQQFKEVGARQANSQLTTVQHSVQQAQQQANFQALGAVFDLASSGLQIGTKAHARNRAVSRSRNTRS